jgi:hypothetical protein
MPAPDGREWIPTSVIAGTIIDCIEAQFPQIQNLNVRAEVMATIEQCWIDNIGYGTERKISRLTEMLKDAVSGGVYGPLSDANGITALGMAYQDWHNIYTEAFLANFDEDGNLIGGG